MYHLPNTNHPLLFPNDYKTTPEGILAIGGNLLPETLLDAYSKGIFPWFAEEDPIIWWHPNPRPVLFPKNVHISTKMRRLFAKTTISLTQNIGDYVDQEHEKSLHQIFKNSPNLLYVVTINKDFVGTIKECAFKRHKGRESTWITPELMASFIQLHQMGFAQSIEVWNRSNQLVGGMYGMAIGKIFFGESMFSLEPNTSKLALFYLCDFLKKNDFYLIDCQVESEHLNSLGAELITRKKFLEYLKKAKTIEQKPPPAFINSSSQNFLQI